ncbi:ATP-binding protein [Pleurocapsa sp. FMAR1]|uniref:hypothetical protein n=1 Tax=Pleurocapsa sp. FMAR1 TaxID=3040204 RepID=UPI0029C96EF9|nr:hypothetical protein [Pleurocapsa sp. FMAR1]
MAMIDQTKSTLTLSWLKTKLIHCESGVIIENTCSCSFEGIQSFIESIDHSSKTPAIYYQAFPEESADQFLDTLREELASKLGNIEFKSNQSLLDIVKAAALKMVIIDRSYLHPLNTINQLLNFLGYCNVSLILVGSRNKLKIAQVLSHPAISQWEQFTICDKSEA